MVYNIGSHDLPLGEIGTKVNDNSYHIVRFQRFGSNATLQLDDYNVQTVHPQGKNSRLLLIYISIHIQTVSLISQHFFAFITTPIHRSSINRIQFNGKYTNWW